jgi:hypothetical protein
MIQVIKLLYLVLVFLFAFTVNYDAGMLINSFRLARR